MQLLLHLVPKNEIKDLKKWVFYFKENFIMLCCKYKLDPSKGLISYTQNQNKIINRELWEYKPSNHLKTSGHSAMISAMEVTEEQNGSD